MAPAPESYVPSVAASRTSFRRRSARSRTRRRVSSPLLGASRMPTARPTKKNRIAIRTRLNMRWRPFVRVNCRFREGQEGYHRVSGALVGADLSGMGAHRLNWGRVSTDRSGMEWHADVGLGRIGQDVPDVSVDSQ